MKPKTNRRFGNAIAKNVPCSCGGSAKLVSKKNYPFGKNSKAVKSQFYKCRSCKKITFLDKGKGGKR